MSTHHEGKPRTWTGWVDVNTTLRTELGPVLFEEQYHIVHLFMGKKSMQRSILGNFSSQKHILFSLQSLVA